MNPRVKKIVLVIQDLQTKDKENIAILSGDIHLNTKDKMKVISFQVPFKNNKDFVHCVNDLVMEAMMLHDKKINK